MLFNLKALFIVLTAACLVMSKAPKHGGGRGAHGAHANSNDNASQSDTASTAISTEQGPGPVQVDPSAGTTDSSVATDHKRPR
ncbi:hypothetical protein H0H93_007657 [Arthromyces matolae]|nr:hypothetical protein H0H93_007657 [Arthromyces matolae]